MLLKIYIILLSSLGLIEFILFALDKQLSKKENASRIPEIVLLSLCNFGGSIGCILAMKAFRHKTIFKTKFHFIISAYTSLILQLILLFIIGWFQL